MFTFKRKALLGLLLRFKVLLSKYLGITFRCYLTSLVRVNGRMVFL